MQIPNYGWQLLGIQPPAVTPGAGLAPPVPPPPSQSHVPRNIGFIAPSAAPATIGAAFDFHPTLAVSETYTDNFQLTAQNKIQDFRTTVLPGFNLLINGPKTQGSVLTSLGVAQDSVNSFGDFSFFPTVSASVTHTFDPRLSVSLVDSLVRSDQPALANPFGLQQQRQTFTSNWLGLSADWLLDLVAIQGYYQLSTFFSTSNTISNILGVDAGIPLGALMAVKAGYELSYSVVSGATSGNTTGNLLWAALSRQINPLMTAGVSTSYSIQTIDSARIWNISLFTTYELPGRLSLSGSVGYSLLTSDAGRNFSTVSTNTNASYRLGPAVISVGLFQDLNQTFTTGENFGIVLTRSYWGSFGYAVTPFIDASLRATYSQNEFTGVGNGGSNQNTLSAQASLAWRLRRWLSTGLNYTYTRYDAGASSGGIATENRVTLGVNASF